MTCIGRKQQGLSLILAIFVLVVLSMLGAAMMNILASGSDSVAREVLATRALLAAESGAQQMLNTIFPPGGTIDPNDCDSIPGDGSPEVHPFPLAGLFGCSGAEVTCAYTTIGAAHYYTIISTGSCGPANDLAVRVIEVQAKDI
ncbi:MAG: hypothetical protein V3T17_08235 [Pseudomonadales bacterium]